jgi:hypothetical protein
MPNVMRPTAVLVSKFSVKLLNAMPRASKSFTINIMSMSERLARSTFYTTSVSPGLSRARNACNFGAIPFRTRGGFLDDFLASGLRSSPTWATWLDSSLLIRA